MNRIRVSPMGEIDRAVLKHLEWNLGQFFEAQAEIGPPLPWPDYAEERKRKQYHSTAIVLHLQTLPPAEDERILAVIDTDLYVPGSNFVFGEADIEKRVAVISLWRLREEYYGLEEEEDLLLERALKEAIHELGHTLGLRHCTDVGCVMHFSNTISDTDRKGREFCDRCSRQVDRALLQLTRLRRP